MPGFPLGLAGHVTKIESHGLQVYVDIEGRIGATCPGGGCGSKWPAYSMQGLPWGLSARIKPLERY